MKLFFPKTLTGILTVQFTSAEPDKILNTIIQANLPISHVLRMDELTYQVQLHHRDYPQLNSVLLRCGSSPEIIRQKGLYWTMKAFLSRPVLMFLVLFLLCSTLFIPSRILFITVEGNVNISDQQILSAAEACGIHFFASRKHVRSEKVKNKLLSSVPQLQWAGINTSGCTAVISIKERKTSEFIEKEAILSNQIADQDGYILSVTTTSGTPHCMPGDTVTKGELLISGYTDCGICIRISRAEGEIFAQTNRKLRSVTPVYHVTAEMSSDTKYRISMLIGKKRINLWKDSRISEACCGRMYEEYYVSLPGGFRLPIAISIDQYRNYEIQENMVSQEAAMEQLQSFSDRYLVRQMVAGQIIRKQQDFSSDRKVYQLDSSYVCIEMIGRECREEIGDTNGKRN